MAISDGRGTVIARAAERAVARRLELLAQAELPPGVTREVVVDGVVLSGRGLARSIAFDARVREIGR